MNVRRRNSLSSQRTCFPRIRGCTGNFICAFDGVTGRSPQTTTAPAVTTTPPADAAKSGTERRAGRAEWRQERRTGRAERPQERRTGREERQDVRAGTITSTTTKRRRNDERRRMRLRRGLEIPRRTRIRRAAFQSYRSYQIRLHINQHKNANFVGVA